MKAKVLITDSVHKVMIENFEANHFEVDYQPSISVSEVFELIDQYTMLVINSKIIVDKAMIDKATNLKVVGRLGSGKEVIDLDYAKEKKILFHNSPEGNRDAVAEHAMGMLLSLMHLINQASAELREGKWLREKNRGTELKDKTVAILGYGNTGMEMAKRLKGFGVRVLAYDKYKVDFSDEFVIESSMQEIFESTDIVSLHLPLTNETEYLVNKDWIKKFKKPFYLINTARGKIIRTSDIVEALQKGSIIAAAFDVLENENIASFTSEETMMFETLVAMNNVILTPHVAGWTFESKYKLASYLSEKMIDSWNFMLL
jgi:D-3-phosphoglycerate dehydrogenase